MHKFDFDLDGEPGLILTLADGHLSDDDPFPALHEGRPLSIQNQDGNIGFWMWAESRHSAANATDTPMMPEAKRIRGDVAAGERECEHIVCGLFATRVKKRETRAQSTRCRMSKCSSHRINDCMHYFSDEFSNA